MGAPKGNTNALRHGLYAKHFSAEEQARLRKMGPEDYRHEIGMMRVTVNNIFEIQVHLAETVKKKIAAGEACDLEGLTKITNSLSLAVTSLGSMARTYALFNGTDANMTDAFDEALNGMAVFLDGKYLNEPEVLVEAAETGAE